MEKEVIRRNSIDGLKTSEIVGCELSIIKVMESVGFDCSTRGDLRLSDDSEDVERWKMPFYRGQKDEIKYSELAQIKKQIGDDFELCISSKEKTGLVINVVGNKSAFLKLIGKEEKPYNSQGLFHKTEV